MYTIKRILSLMAVAFGLILPLAASSSFAQQIISYQGLATNNGTPLTGTHNLEIAIYADSNGGTAIYSEAQINVEFTDGIFNIEIGTNKANPLPIFDAGSYSGSPRLAPNYFVGVSIDGGAELTPRSKLGTAPTAWSSRFADSAHVAETANTASTATTALNGLPSGAIITFGDSGAHPGYTFTGMTPVGGNTWSTGAVLPVAQGEMTSAVVNGKIYVIGGGVGSQNNNQIYDPVANTWSTGAALPVGQYLMTSAVVNGKIYVIGGLNSGQNNNQIYDPVANTWSTGAVLPVGQNGMTSAVVNGRIFVMGGNNNGQSTNQIYDPVANTWSTGTAIPHGGNNLGSAVVNGKIYVIGAMIDNQIYNPVTNTWSTGAVQPFEGLSAACAVVAGKIYVFEGNSNQNNPTQIYEPVTNTWSTGAELPLLRTSPTFASVNGQIYVIGGDVNQNNNQIYTPGLNLYYFTKN